MKNRETAIDLLFDKIKHIIPNDFLICFEQAKELEKEQTIAFANKVLYNAECSFTGIAYLEKGINELYKEEYEK